MPPRGSRNARRGRRLSGGRAPPDAPTRRRTRDDAAQPGVGQGGHAQARQPRGHGRRAGDRCSRSSRRTRRCASAADERLTRNLAQLQADHERPAAQRDVDADGADPPDVPEDGAAGPRPEQEARARRSSWCCRARTPSSTASVVEDINDPLMHMVRNSVDHGIEDGRRARAARGKRADGPALRSAPSTRAATSSSRLPTTARG